LDRLIGQRIQLPKQCCSTDLSHDSLQSWKLSVLTPTPSIALIRSDVHSYATFNTRSSASFSIGPGLFFTHVLHPSRAPLPSLQCQPSGTFTQCPTNCSTSTCTLKKPSRIAFTPSAFFVCAASRPE